MWPNPQETADLVTFTNEVLNDKLHFLCSVTYFQVCVLGQFIRVICTLGCWKRGRILNTEIKLYGLKLLMVSFTLPNRWGDLIQKRLSNWESYLSYGQLDHMEGAGIMVTKGAKINVFHNILCTLFKKIAFTFTSLVCICIRIYQEECRWNFDRKFYILLVFELE